jgi:molybdopterin converting factor small subunit
MQVRVRLGPGLGAADRRAQSSDSSSTTAPPVADALARLAADQPVLAEPLHAALPRRRRSHAERDRPLRAGEELALVTPVSGG